MNVHELCEDGQQLTGYVDVQMLSHLLPDVTSLRDFDNAIDKLRLGQENALILPEKMQLALAFVSLLRATQPQKQRIVRNLMGVQAPMARQQQPAQPAAAQPAQSEEIA